MVKIRYKIITCILAVLTLFACFSTVSTVVNANDNAVEYTDVLVDLQKDDKFKINDYPANANDNSLDVIQIAESVNKELFVYVYQPSAFKNSLMASSIRLSVPEVGKDSTYKDYPLELINKNGQFQKYKVKDLTVKDASVRYYEIVQIERPFSSKIDTAPTNGNTISTVPFEIGQKWEIATINGQTSYRMLDSEVITITDKFVGFVRYWDGLNWTLSYTDSHFVAFSTDRSIDKLLEVDISFFKQPYSQALVYGYEADFTLYEGELVPLKTLELTNEGSNDADGWFGRKYTWREIASTSSFLSEMDDLEVHITNAGALALENTQWLLRFEETAFDESVMQGTSIITGILVSDVTILRLKFETDGKTYNLGVVDNKQTGSTEPVGTVDKLDFSNVKNALMSLLKIVLILVAVVVIVVPLCLVLSFILPLLKVVFNFLIKVIVLPFKLIGKLFKKKDKRYKRK